MTIETHNKEMAALEEKFIARLADQDDVISNLKYELSEWHLIAGALKMLGKKIAESKEISP